MMNMRIEEIAEQCYVRENLFNNASLVTPLSFDHQKFAELIIQECCDLFVELRTRPADLAVLDVKKHFGVE